MVDVDTPPAPAAALPPLCELVRDYQPAAYRATWAQEAWEHRAAAALRRAVFCAEQGVFAGDDLDAIDQRASTRTLVAVSLVGGQPDQVVGTVRLHPGEADDGVWWGSRLAVHAAFRRQGAIGATLIRLAVCSAHAQGAQVFLAHVQAANRPLFERLHWRTLKDETLHGRPHCLMQADLSQYPPCTTPHVGFVSRARGG